jgi:hypothetical protein
MRSRETEKNLVIWPNDLGKNSHPDMSTFYPNKSQKIDTFGCLVRIWFQLLFTQIFGFLGI